ncbi:MAG: phage tail protein [Deltaproteobacteria bacterium]|nr:phage tail protein [Deltaproteobacteria bacterium]
MIVISKIEGLEDLQKKLKGLPRVTEKATVSALNKLASQANTQAKRAVVSEYRIRTKDLNPFIKLFRASAKAGGKFYARIQATGYPFPLMKFDARTSASIAKKGSVPPQKGIPVKNRKAVYVRIKKKQGKKKVGHAFYAKMKSGHVGIFKREGKESLPINERFTLGPMKMFQKAGIKAIKEVVRTKGREIFQHELDYYLLKEAKMLPAKRK